MARRVSSSQLRQAVSRYNSKVRQLNRAIDSYNHEARAHNSRVRANRRRLESELRRLARPTPTRVRVTYRSSVTTLHRSFVRLESAAEDELWAANNDLLDLSEGETANSVAALNALVEPDAALDTDDPFLRETAITNELLQIDPDLDARWRGALFALDPHNPDAARHFCTSSREILTSVIDGAAADEDVLRANPNAERTRDGSVSRRARIRHCLERRDIYSVELVDFVEADVDDVLMLLTEFNTGTHGAAGRFTLDQLRALKVRVEHAIGFLHRVVA
jgi:hypothetical protein